MNKISIYIGHLFANFQVLPEGSRGHSERTTLVTIVPNTEIYLDVQWNQLYLRQTSTAII